MKKITLWAAANKKTLIFKRTYNSGQRIYGIYNFNNEYEIWHTMQGHGTYELHKMNSEFAILITSRSEDIIKYLQKKEK